MGPRTWVGGWVTGRKDEVLASESEFVVMWTLSAEDPVTILTNLLGFN